MALRPTENDPLLPTKPTNLRHELFLKLQKEGGQVILPDGTIVELIAHTKAIEDIESNPENNFSLGYFTTSGETPVSATGRAPNLNTDSMFDCNLSTEQFTLLITYEPVIKKVGELGLDMSKIVNLSVGVNVASGGAIPKR